jgi:hypothetical protein
MIHMMSAALIVLLAVLFFGILFNEKFRDAVLGSDGEAKLFGLITVRGASVVLLAALLVGASVYLELNAPPSVVVTQCGPDSCITPDGKCGVVRLTLRSLLQDGRAAPDSTDATIFPALPGQEHSGSKVNGLRKPAVVWQCVPKP